LRTAITAGHVGRGAGFVDEDQPLRIKSRLFLAQGLTRGGDIRPILLGGVEDFFLKVRFKWCRNRKIAD
jgi:hypothetical protein